MALAAALLILSALVAIHELGHLIAARLTGVPVREFAIGMGPCIVSYRPPPHLPLLGGVLLCLRLLPLGGYVRFGKEEGAAGAEKGTTSLLDPLGNIAPLKRVAIALAGPAASVAAMFLLFLASAAVWGSPPRPDVSGFSRKEAATFEPAFAAAIQATENPRIALPGAENDDPLSDHRLSSPTSEWSRPSPQAALWSSLRATGQAVIIMGGMMKWLITNPDVMYEHIGGPVGIVDGGAQVAATSTRLPPPTPATLSPSEAGSVALTDSPATASSAATGPTVHADAGSSPGKAADSGTKPPASVTPPPTHGEPASPSPPDTRWSLSGIEWNWSPPSLSETRGYALLLLYMGLLSVCIAYINLLPLPPFDGFQALLSSIEWLAGHRVPLKARAAMGVCGALLFVGLLGRGTWNDLTRDELRTGARSEVLEIDRTIIRPLDLDVAQ